MSILNCVLFAFFIFALAITFLRCRCAVPVDKTLKKRKIQKKHRGEDKAKHVSPKTKQLYPQLPKLYGFTDVLGAWQKTQLDMKLIEPPEHPRKYLELDGLAEQSLLEIARYLDYYYFVQQSKQLLTEIEMAFSKILEDPGVYSLFKLDSPFVYVLIEFLFIYHKVNGKSPPGQRLYMSILQSVRSREVRRTNKNDVETGLLIYITAVITIAVLSTKNVRFTRMDVLNENNWQFLKKVTSNKDKHFCGDVTAMMTLRYVDWFLALFATEENDSKHRFKLKNEELFKALSHDKFDFVNPLLFGGKTSFFSKKWLVSETTNQSATQSCYVKNHKIVAQKNEDQLISFRLFNKTDRPALSRFIAATKLPLTKLLTSRLVLNVWSRPAYVYDVMDGEINGGAANDTKLEEADILSMVLRCNFFQTDDGTIITSQRIVTAKLNLDVYIVTVLFEFGLINVVLFKNLAKDFEIDLINQPYETVEIDSKNHNLYYCKKSYNKITLLTDLSNTKNTKIYQKHHGNLACKWSEVGAKHRVFGYYIAYKNRINEEHFEINFTDSLTERTLLVNSEKRQFLINLDAGPNEFVVFPSKKIP